jgi:hypothetical protein
LNASSAHVPSTASSQQTDRIDSISLHPVPSVGLGALRSPKEDLRIFLGGLQLL